MKLVKYVTEEEFDTDSLKMDFREEGGNGNIAIAVNNNKHLVINIGSFIFANESMYQMIPKPIYIFVSDDINLFCVVYSSVDRISCWVHLLLLGCLS